VSPPNVSPPPFQKEVIHTQQAEKLNKYSMIDWLMPATIVRFVLNTFTVLETDWGLNLTWVGIDNSQYQPASATVTCLHRYGLEEAFATFPNIQPTPLMVSAGLVVQKPWVLNGQVVPRRIITLCFTVDHRVMDGNLGGKLMKATKKHIEAFLTDPLPTQSPGIIPKAKL
jgi:hypothetical protein